MTHCWQWQTHDTPRYQVREVESNPHVPGRSTTYSSLLSPWIYSRGHGQQQTCTEYGNDAHGKREKVTVCTGIPRYRANLYSTGIPRCRANLYSTGFLGALIVARSLSTQDNTNTQHRPIQHSDNELTFNNCRIT